MQGSGVAIADEGVVADLLVQEEREVFAGRARLEVGDDRVLAKRLKRDLAGKFGFAPMVDERRETEPVVNLRLCTEALGLRTCQCLDAFAEQVSNRAIEGA